MGRSGPIVAPRAFPPEGPPAGALRAVVEELVRGGVRDVVICPGSRSTPLALALRAEPGLRCWVHLDERVGVFFALGAAKASRRPVAILVTSGTAAAELLPAIVEARHGRVPLIALSADRPPELRDRGAAQTIDQDHLFGRAAKWYAELPVPEHDATAERHTRDVVMRAVATALASPAGPVHLNLPYREPLLPVGDLTAKASSNTASSPSGLPAATGSGFPAGTAPAHAAVLIGRRMLTAEDAAGLAERISAARRGVLVCGPLDAPGFAEAITELAACSGFPVIADALANVRFGPHDRSHVIARADALLREPAFATHHRPDLIVRFGGTPTSKALLTWLDAADAGQVVVDDGGWNAPNLVPMTMVQADPLCLARDLAARLAESRPPHAWLDSWRAAEHAAHQATLDWLQGVREPFEGQVPAGLADSLSHGAILFVGSSMPVRDLEAFSGSGAAAIRCLGNRGANGIDGLVSTALGLAAAVEAPVVAVVGDVAFLHDLGALVAARRLGISATIVVVNNDGGGIFSFLPQAAAADPEVGLPVHFEELFGTPHGIDLGPLVRALGARHDVVSSAEAGRRAASLSAVPGVRVLEVRTERRRNVELHRQAQLAVAAALEAIAPQESTSPLAGASPLEAGS